MKKIFFFLVGVTYLYAFNINESLLNIHATLVPKLTLMDYKFQEKLNNGTITIVIYYTKADYKSAQQLKDKMNIKYKDGINKHPIDVRLISYKDKESIKANIYYLFPSNTKELKEVLTQAYKNSILTFSYSADSLAKGSMVSLNIGTKVKPIINLNAIKFCNISLRPILLKISTIYTNSKVK